MTDYVSIHKRPYYTEAQADGYKNGRNPTSGNGMAAYFYGQTNDDDPDKEKTDHMNSAWLVGWFAGSSDWTKENPDSRIVVINEQLPLKETSSD